MGEAVWSRCCFVYIYIFGITTLLIKGETTITLFRSSRTSASVAVTPHRRVRYLYTMQMPLNSKEACSGYSDEQFPVPHIHSRVLISENEKQG